MWLMEWGLCHMDLISHAYIQDEEFVKLILSSGDFFPGFYRFTMGDRNEEEGQLTIPGLIASTFGEGRSKEDWLDFTKKRLEQSNIRSRERSDDEVYKLISDKYTNWMFNADKYDIAVIEIDNGVDEIVPDQSYFLMGSLIRFTSTEFSIGYDLLRDTATLRIPIDFNKIKEYCHTIYGDNLKDFFLPADLIATVDVNSGVVDMTEDTIARAMVAHSNSVLIASNHDVAKGLPIRWAKDILLSDYVY